MKVRYTIALAALAGSFLSSGALAWEQNPFAMYIQRSDTITLGAGNARDVNAATHMIDPWPYYVGNRRIPGNGERMSGAVERYRDVSKLRDAPRPIAPIINGQIGFNGGGGASTTPAR